VKVWPVTFTDEFTLYVEAESREAAKAAAEEAVDSGQVADWGDEDYKVGVASCPAKTPPADHGIIGGRLVHIEDARKAALAANAHRPPAEEGHPELPLEVSP
jgi:hypothetical protein